MYFVLIAVNAYIAYMLKRVFKVLGYSYKAATALMLVINNKTFPRNTIIELCILPDVKVHNIMIDISKQSENNFFIDTVGNLCSCLDIKPIFAHKQFIRVLKRLASERDFFLFIDSITFMLKKTFRHQPIYNLLWSLVYKNNATIIVSNHYRVYYNKLKPMMTSKWTFMIGYRIFMRCSDGSIRMEVINNPVMELLQATKEDCVK